MSKLKKALRGFQQGTGSQSSNQVPADSRSGGTPSNGKHVENSDGVLADTRSSNIRQDSLVRTSSGALASHSVAIDLNKLTAAGLAPKSEDLEVISQQFRRIKRPILRIAFESASSRETNANVVMMASALPGAGKTFCSYNLGQSIALEQDVGVILVDADVIKTGLSEHLGLQERPGLIDYLVDPGKRVSDVLIQTDQNGIAVIPSGVRHPQATELLAGQRMRRFVDMLSEEFSDRAIIVDTPPLLLTSEAQVLAQICGQVVMVIEARVSSQETVARAVSMLDRNKPINAILNKSRSAAERDYQGGPYSSYSYYAGRARGGDDEAV